MAERSLLHPCWNWITCLCLLSPMPLKLILLWPQALGRAPTIPIRGKELPTDASFGATPWWSFCGSVIPLRPKRLRSRRCSFLPGLTIARVVTLPLPLPCAMLQKSRRRRDRSPLILGLSDLLLPPYLPFEVAHTLPSEPLILVLPFASLRPDQFPVAKRQPLDHPNAIQAITALHLTIPTVAPWSPALQSLQASGIAQ